MPARATGFLFCMLATAPLALAQSSSFTLTTLADFSGPNGALPVSNLIQASDGNYYGTTLRGGEFGFGSVYQLTPAGTIATIHSFTGPDGRYPYGSLVEGEDGYLYGTTTEGGALEMGSVYRILPNGAITTLHSFTGADGNTPYASLVLATDGNFYGTTAGGGAKGEGYGTLFRMTPTGVVSTIHSLSNTYDGMLPYNNLLQASDGNLYGVSSTGGGPNNNGVVFRSSLSGVVSGVGFTGDQTLWPYTALDQDSSGVMYGTTSTGGATGHGEIFSVDSDLAIQDVFDFPASGDGGIPFAGLVLSSDGNQYGTTAGYFTAGGGFSLTSSGQVDTVATLSSKTGEVPVSAMIQGSDGNLYGTTSAGGSSSQGTIFRLTATDPLPAPVQLVLTPTSVAAGGTVKLSWQVINAFSDTLQQCYAFVNGNPAGAGSWTGLQRGTLSGDSYTGGATIVPTTPGQYTYALTCGGVESGFANLTVTGTTKLPALTQLTTSATTLIQGESITLRATIGNLKKNKGNPTPTGTITFHYGQRTIAEVPLTAAGSASVTGSSSGIPAGNYILSASYSGDANYAPSNSAGVSVVLRAQTSSVLSITPAAIPAGTVATLLAAVSEKNGPQVPTGVVAFYCRGLLLGRANLLGGQATLTQSAEGLPAGTYPIVATYEGDTGNAASTSPPLIVVVSR